MQTVHLATVDQPVGAAEGVVYSTAPRRAEGADAKSYFIKGPEKEITFPELAGCLLARELGVLVPDVNVCVYSQQRLAGSVKVSEALRDASPLLKHPTSIGNYKDIYEVIVVDTWLANADRNMGNVLARSVGGRKAELIMIDFEKSHALRPNPIVTCPTIPARNLWPTSELGQMLRPGRGQTPPEAMVAKIRAFERDRCEEILQDVSTQLGGVAWVDNSIMCLMSRAENIQQLAEEVWA